MKISPIKQNFINYKNNSNNKFQIKENANKKPQNFNFPFDYSMLNFCAQSAKPVYLFDVVSGACTRFNSVDDVASFLKVAKSYIYNSAIQKKAINGFVILKASEVELKDENDEIKLDFKGSPLLNQDLIKQARAEGLSGGYDFPVLFFDRSGKVNFFSTKKLLLYSDINPDKGRVVALSDVVLKKDNEVVFDEENNFMLDYDKLEQLYRETFVDSAFNPFAIYKKMILNRQDAESKMSILSQIEKAKDTAQDKEEQQGYYILRYDGTYEKYPTMSAILEALDGDVTRASVRNSIYQNKKAIGERCFFEASSLETQNEDGVWEVDKQKVKKALEKFSGGSNQPLYLIDIDGTYKRYSSRNECIKQENVQRSEFVSYLNGSRSTFRSGACVEAFDFELRDENGVLLKNLDGTPKINTEMLRKIIQETIENSRHIVSVHKSGKVEIFPTAKRASDELLNLALRTPRSARDVHSIKGEYAFLHLSQAIKRDENGNFVFDEFNKYVLDEEYLNELADILVSKRSKKDKNEN